MVLGGLQSLDVLTIVLFLLPGLLSVKVGLERADRADWLNRIDTIGLSFAISFVSIGIIYFFYSYHAGYLLDYAGVKSAFSELKFAIANYLMLLWIAVSLGFLLGGLDFGRKLGIGSPDPWTSFFQDVKEDSEEGEYVVVVHTKSGAELVGSVIDEGETAENRDLRLEDPTRTYFDEGGGEIRSEEWTGYAYLHNQEIAHVETDRLDNAQQDAGERPLDMYVTMAAAIYILSRFNPVESFKSKVLDIAEKVIPGYERPNVDSPEISDDFAEKLLDLQENDGLKDEGEPDDWINNTSSVETLPEENGEGSSEDDE